MAIGVPVQLGNAASSSSATATITTIADSPAGALIFVWFGSDAITNTTSVTDSAGNTYVGLTKAVSTSGVQGFYCENAAALATGGTIVGHITGSFQTIYISANSTTGILTASSLDINGAGTTGTGTSPSIATGTLAQASELVMAGCSRLSPGAETWTEASGFTTDDTMTGTGTTTKLHTAHQIVAATTTVTYAPAGSLSKAYRANVYTFKGGSADVLMAQSIF